VPQVPRSADNYICIIHKGDRPSDKSAATLQEEKANPEKRQRRLEDNDCKKINFFTGHTRATVSPGTSATVSAGADTVCVVVLVSEDVLVHESLSDPDDRLEDRLGLDHKSMKFLCLSVLLSPSLTHSLSR
jgi:hypothetical protein